MKKLLLLIGLLLVLSSLTGCLRKYDKPEFVEIKPNQTAFVVPLEGKTSDQGKFESEEFLKKAQVATKRIQIPHKWVQTGRWKNTGKYIDEVRVIIVDRNPETREWTNDNNGTSTKAQGFIGESSDSIKFSLGLSATAQIMEEDSAKFLYLNSGKTLAQVMDFEIRNKIGTVLLEKYGSMDMATIRKGKTDVIEHVRKVVEPYFKDRGITLSNIGYVGDLQYVDPSVQQAINKAFNAKQEQEAQITINETLLAKANNEIQVAEAEAKAVEKRRSIINETIRLKELENQAELIKVLPQIKLPTVMSGNGGTILDLPESLLESVQNTKKK